METLRDAIERGERPDSGIPGLTAIWSDHHLFEPLLYLTSDGLEVSPVPMNKGEKRFVDDLADHCAKHPERLEEHKAYLLRNLSRGRGIGFFEAGNFHPDFILWVVSESGQNVAFVDPKGIRQFDPDDPKIAFAQRVKDVEDRLGDPTIHLDSFIVSNTPSHVMARKWPGIDKTEMTRRHILFQEEDRGSYIAEMLERMMS